MDRVFLGRLERHRAATRPRQQKLAREAGPTELAVEFVEIAAGEGFDVGIDHGGTGPFVLAVLPQEPVGQGDRNLRADGAQNPLHRQFMLRIGVAVKETDGDGGDPRRPQAGRHVLRLKLVEGRVGVALEGHPLVDLEDAMTGHQRRRFTVLEVVHRLPVGPAEFIHIPESEGRYDRHARAAARRQGVDAQGRPVDGRNRSLKGRPPPFRSPPARHAPARAGWFRPSRGQPTLVHDDDIRKGPADVDRHVHDTHYALLRWCTVWSDSQRHVTKSECSSTSTRV